MKSKIIRYKIALFLLFSSFWSFAAQVESNNSPYDVVYNHVHFMKKSTYDELQASYSFNIANKKKRINAAIMLKEILDAKVDQNSLLSKIPDDPDYSDSIKRRHIFVLYDKMPQVFVEKSGDKWYYSQSTVDAIPELHKKIFPFGTNIWAHWFPYKQNEEFLRLHPWQWIGIGIIFSIFLLCIFLFKYLFRFIFYKIVFKKYVSEFQDLDKLKMASNLISVWIGFKILQLFVPTLFINPGFAVPVIKGVDFVAATLMVLIFYKLVELFIFYAKKYAQKTTTQWDDQIVVVVQKFLKFIVIFLGLFYVLNTLDVNIATIIAGLSVGGLALALAAQDTVKNFIASVMIFIDKPFKIGDTIKGDNFEGTVQEVGFRSTRIKTADESLVYIANAKLSEMTIDNKGYRVFKKYKTEVSVSYDTPLFKIEQFLEGIRTILYKYPYTKNSTIDVHLTNIQAAGLSITISYTYKVYNQREEFQHREFILLQILRLSELLQIKLFEQSQVMIQHTNEKGEMETPEDVNHKMEKFFSDLNTQVAAKVK
jgi:MscS family membrane protein